MNNLKKFNENMNMSNSFVTQPSIFTRQVVYSVDSDDKSSLIQGFYGRNPEIEASLELGHDDTFEISANGDELDEVEFNQWKVKPVWQRSEIYMLMNKLAFDGHIKNGDYLIKTC